LAKDEVTGVTDVEGGVGPISDTDDAAGNATPHLWHDAAERSLMASHA
jgi:hypothetical protein